MLTQASDKMVVDLNQRMDPGDEDRDWEAHVNFLREQDS
jgi:hypothetical protein